MSGRVKARIARALIAHSERVATEKQREWVGAMARELEHLPGNASVLSWALGCVAVSYKGRLRCMARISEPIPRWALILEMLCCLAPASVYFLFVATSTSQGYTLFLPTGGLSQLQQGLVFSSATLIGPVALVVALRVMASQAYRPRQPTIITLWILVAWSFFIYVKMLLPLGGGLRATAIMLLTLVLLPAVAIAHLGWIGSQRRSASVL